jgi:hypothetical protein
VIKGAAWSPASIGTTSDALERRQEFARWYVTDIQLLRAMNANTVYVFLDFGTNATAFAILDNLYKNGLKAIVTVDEDGTANSNRVRQVVTAYRNHPAVLAWAIGNEWNINLYHQTFTNILAAATATERLARQVKALDAKHPVTAIYGDIDIPGLNPLRKSNESTNQPVSTERIVNDLCPSVDLWGLNIYRGSSFGSLFDQWRAITQKPMFLSEYGTDAYRIFSLNVLDGAEDELMQADFNRDLWNEIASHLAARNLMNICVGGTVFEWNDEWWKARPEHGATLDVQDNLGFGGAHPDGFANEEWFAIVAIDRRVRRSYLNYQSDFAATLASSDIDADGLPDAWEYQIVDFADGDSVGDIGAVLPGGDFDGDGFLNRDEYLADTDPTRAQSAVRFVGISRSNSTVRLEWSGGINATQYLERAVSLSSTSTWVRLLTITPPAAVTNQYLDAGASNSATHFYRLRVER